MIEKLLFEDYFTDAATMLDFQLRSVTWHKDETGCYDFKTGFPIDFVKIRQQLGPKVTIHGGPNIMLLRDDSPDEVTAETRLARNLA